MRHTLAREAPRGDPLTDLVYLIWGAVVSWMHSDLVLARSVDQIDGPGRYVIRWADGDDKTVVEAWRHSNEEICVRFHAPERQVIMTEVESENGVTVFQKEDGSKIDVEVLGMVVFPDDATQIMTEGMADTASRIINGASGQ